jgi:hypothetical protein
VQSLSNDELQRQIDDLVASLAAFHNDMDSLRARADVAHGRADAADLRADASEAQSRLDRMMIAELQADGLISHEHVAQLEQALATSRTIGAAIGILMATRNIGQEEALTVLKGASSRSNTRMRDLAETIVSGVDAIK